MDEHDSQAEPKEPPAEEMTGAAGPESSASGGGAQNLKIPPASFETLVTLLATQALANLGQIPGPDAQASSNLPLARHYIDTLAVLEKKTEGNLSESERAMLEQSLHSLRMIALSAR